MEPMNFNSVFFVKLHIYNYGPFLGPNDFVFDRHRTLIIGEGGVGKTIIVNGLSSLGQQQESSLTFARIRPKCLWK